MLESKPISYRRMHDCEARWVTQPRDFLAMRAAWNRLSECCRPRSVFLRHEWFESAWQWLKDAHPLLVLAIYRDGELIGLCPLVRGQGRVRRVELMVIPDTQECRLLAAPENLSLVWRCLANALRQIRTSWDVLDLRLIPAAFLRESRVEETLAGSGLRPRVIPDDENRFIMLAGGWDNFYKTRSRRLKKGNNLAANKLSKAGEVELEWHHDQMDGTTADALLDEIIALSARSWKTRTNLTLDNTGPQAFIRTLTRLAAANGWLSLFILRLDGCPVAMEYQLAFEGRVHALRADFDQDRRDLSPGTYLNWKLLERLFSGGAEMYFMGPGTNPYKTRWTEQHEPLCRLTAYSPTTRGRLEHLWQQSIRPVAAAIRQRIHASRPKQIRSTTR